MPLSRRYTPELAPGESSIFGMDFSEVVPPGVGLEGGDIEIKLNTKPPLDQQDLTPGPVYVLGRTLYATVTADSAAAGRDFLITWVAYDTAGNVWPRTALVLCALTS